jgi:large subunit ribosomal protein L25
MASHDLKVQTRERSGKEAAKKLRRDGLVPAVIYGRKEEPIRLAVNAKELRDFLSHHGSHGLFNLRAEDAATADTPALIKALQKHPVKQHVLSVDFLRVSLSETVRAIVPIILDGEPVGVKRDGGVLVQALHEIEIEALPQNLPEAIHVDVTGLEFDGAPIHVHEVTFPQGVSAFTAGEESIAVVNPPQREAEPTEETSADEVPAAHGDTATAEDAGQA